MEKQHFNIEKEATDLLNWLGDFGKDPEGGITRLLYTPEWIGAQNGLKMYMEKDGFKTYSDDIGNLFSRLDGSKYKDETVLTGSHIDTVRNAGHYDGQLGIVAGMIALKYLKMNYGEPLRNIELVAMAEEEGSRFPFSFWGSKNIVGIAKKKDVEGIQDSDGTEFPEAMRRAGYTFKAPDVKPRTDIKAFVELHAEQGGILEEEQIPIGIVQNIVGQRRYTIEISGEANHAGTTPMGYRHDTFNAASRMAVAIDDITLEYGDPLVSTIGQVEVKPNTVNVVPGKTTFTIDCRHTDKEILVKATEEMEEAMKRIALEQRVDVKIDRWADDDPVPLDQRVVRVIENQCKQNGLHYKLMHSGAGHDSQIIAPFAPTAMIFVPSHKGISHNPLEYTEPKDVAEGIKALIRTLYKMGYEEDILE